MHYYNIKQYIFQLFLYIDNKHYDFCKNYSFESQEMY